MSVLIVGGAGYIGSQTAKVVAAAGLEPVVLDNLVYGHEWAVKWGPLVRGDLADRALLVDVMKRHRVDAVIHFAAYAYVGESVTNPRKYFGNNVAGTLNAREGFPFIPNILSPNRPNGLGTVRVMVEPYATSRYDNLMLIDLKAEKRITLSKVTMNASVDVFNLGNANTVLARVTTQNAATANRVTEVTGPRVLRFGLRFQF